VQLLYVLFFLDGCFFKMVNFSLQANDSIIDSLTVLTQSPFSLQVTQNPTFVFFLFFILIDFI